MTKVHEIFPVASQHFSDNRHVNIRGSRIVVEQIAGFLLSAHKYLHVEANRSKTRLQTGKS